MRGRITPGRATGVLALVAVLTVVALPVLLAKGSPSQGVDFREAGHWVYHHGLKAAFHIHGGSKKTDARINLPGIRQGGPVVQGDTHAYVIDGTTVVGFGMSTLTVDVTMPTGLAEQPVPLEVPGGPYLVYPGAGTVVRLGLPPASLPVGGPVLSTVATDDGAVWVHRADTGALCFLARTQQQFQCVDHAPAGGSATLTALGGAAGLFDSVAGTLAVLDAGGLRAPVPVLGALSTGALVAAAGSAGRLAVLDPQGPVLHLVDTGWVDDPRQGVGSALSVRLEPGRYARPVAAGSSVAVLDLTRARLLTYGVDGIRRGAAPVAAPADRVRVVPGADGRVYVDDAGGAHTLVVDGDGSVTGVPIGGADGPAANKPRPTRPPVPPRSPTPAHPAPTGMTGVARAGTAGTPLRALAPGTPAPVAVQAGDQQVTVSWSAAAPRGAPVTAYQLAWTAAGGAAGSTTVAGNTLTSTVAGLTNGTAYRFTVAARSRVGLGPAAASAPVTPSADVPSAPERVTATAAPDGTVTVSWRPADGRGSPIARYEVAAAGRDGGTAIVARPSGTSVRLTGSDGLTLGMAYTFTVTATNERNLASVASRPSNPVLPYAPARAPGALVARVADGAVELSWAAPALGGGDLLGYEVTGAGLPSRRVAGRSTRYTGLTNGRPYRFSVRATTGNPAHRGGPPLAGASASVSATPGVVPAVRLDGVALTGDRQVAVRVTVDDRTSGAVTCQFLFNGLQRWRSSCRGSQTVTVSGLDHGTDYDVSVRPVNAFGTGTVSGHARVRTNEAPVITVSRGGHHGINCVLRRCAWLNVTVRHFAPNTAYTFRCRSSRTAVSQHEFTRRTDGAGALSVRRGCLRRPLDRDAWVTVGGLESNHLRW